MAFAGTILTVFIASPGDTNAERDVIENALHHWNGLRGKREGVVLLPRRWERDAARGLTGPAQQSINSRLLEQSDIVLAVLDTRLGTATPDYVSGTAEEILRAHAAGKAVHVWFSREPIARDANPDELKRLQDFERELRELGLLGEYNTLDELARQVQDEIERDLEDRDLNAAENGGVPASASLDVDELLVRLNDAVDETNRAKAESLLLLSDLLSPVLRQLGQLALMTGSDRSDASRRVVTTVLASRSLLFPDVPGARMVVYRIRGAAGNEELVVEDWGGRPRDEPRSFVRGDGARGDAAFNWLRAGPRRPRFTPDTAAETDPDWRGTGQGYSTYVSLPLIVQSDVFGMLTVDAPLPGDLDETDLPVLQVLAQCISLGYALG